MEFEPYDHLQATEDDAIAPGVYRVVGVDDAGVTLLAVTDAGGTRRNTGRVERLDHDAAAALSPTGNPDDSLAGRLRQVPRMYAAHRWLTTASLVGVVVGAAGRWAGVGLSPDLAQTVLVAGVALLAGMTVQAVR